MLFEKRKPIYAGVTYIFDALNESNMAASTSVVTTIKKSKKKKHWIVLSVNSGDIFECHENLLTEFVEYDKVNDIIRCQYGTTEFNMADVAIFDIITKGLDMMATKIDDEEFKKLNEQIKEYSINLKKKIKKYAEISEYKYMIKSIGSIKKEKPNSKEENDVEAIEEIKDVLEESGFYEKFDEEVNRYMYTDEDIKEFIDNSLDLLESYFPKEAMIPARKELKNITEEDIKCLCNSVIKALLANNMVFLIGVVDDKQKAICMCKTDDAYMMTDFISTCYNDWNTDSNSYYSEYRIVMLTVPIKPSRYMRGE